MMMIMMMVMKIMRGVPSSLTWSGSVVPSSPGVLYTKCGAVTRILPW
jgi:hypothetical protein